MTPEQMLVADKIMLLHKTKNKPFHWENHIEYDGENSMLPQHINDRTKHNWLRLIKYDLIEKGLITELNEEETTLTDEGEKFKNFDIYYNIIRKKEKEERLTSWPQRNWLIISVLTFFSGWATEIFRNTIETSSNTKSSISIPATPKSIDTVLNDDLNPSYDSLLKNKLPPQ